MLCVEVDGPIHEETREHDISRTRWLNEQGIKVVRFSSEDVARKPAVVLERIAEAAAPTTPKRRSPTPRA
jgi:5-methyltetrahydrofolate--homocysteine methyltransferase